MNNLKRGFMLNVKKSYRYRIKTQYFQGDLGNSTLQFQDTITLQTMSIGIAELAENFELLAEFNPRDIFAIAYCIAQCQMAEEAKMSKQLIGYVDQHD
ncbi:MAG: hypothetical protein HWD59_02680 [Coxiellaceae bacterium]|nr:MAG: hypothetical protein HWD59_02680 [Coxiellaceae bacterium]